MEHPVPFPDPNAFASAAMLMFSNGAGSASHLDVRAVALPAFIDTSTGAFPIASLAKSNTAAATPQQGPDKDASSDFLALLLAGLGFEAEPQGPPETAPVSGSLNPQRGIPKKSSIAPVKEIQTAQSGDVALLSPLPVATTQTGVARLMPQIPLEFRKATGSRLSEGSSDAIVNAEEVSRGAVVEKAPAVAAAAAAIPATTPEPAAPEPASSPEIASPSASTKAAPDSGGPAPPPQNEAEIAFEARIHLRTSDDQDQTALPGGTETAETPGTLQPAIRTSNSGPVPASISETSHSGLVSQVSRPASVQWQDHKGSGKPEPVKSPQNQTDDDSISEKLPPDNDANDDSAGREQPDSAALMPSTVPNEIPVDGAPFSQEAQSSGGLLPAPAPAIGFQAAGLVKSEPSTGLTAQDISAAAPPIPSAGAPARDIAIQLQDPGGPRVDVQLSDRAGTVYVVVRTPDDGLAKDLRANLPDLAQKLSQQGTDGDAWSPVETRNTAGDQPNPGHAQEQAGGNSQSSSNGRDPGGRNGEREQRQHPDQEDEFEQSFSGALTGVTTWQPIR